MQLNTITIFFGARLKLQFKIMVGLHKEIDSMKKGIFLLRSVFHLGSNFYTQVGMSMRYQPLAFHSIHFT
jgi:hypothetical protein